MSTPDVLCAQSTETSLDVPRIRRDFPILRTRVHGKGCLGMGRDAGAEIDDEELGGSDGPGDYGCASATIFSTRAARSVTQRDGPRPRSMSMCILPV